jgi:hypothetical protein
MKSGINDRDEEPDRMEVLQNLLESGDIKAATEFARTVEDGWLRAETLCRLAVFMVENGFSEEARPVWQEAINVARDGELSSSSQDSIDSSSVLREISEAIAVAGDFKLAEEAAHGIKNAGKRQRALDAIAKIRS